MADRSPILLVEGNADDEYLTMRALRRIGIEHHVEVARSGAEAVALVLGGRSYRAVLLELALPVVPGTEVLDAIRGNAATHDLPVFVLISAPSELDCLSKRGLDVTGWLTRPIDPALIASLLGHPPAAWPASSARFPSLLPR